MTAVMATPLVTALAEVPDFRKSQGKRHSLVAILALSVAAVMSGAQSLTAISQWGREHEPSLLARLGFTHFPGPSIATLHRVFSQLDVVSLEHVLTEWWQTWLPALGPLALDGKTVRGSGHAGGPALQLLAAFATQVRLVLAQRAIAENDEIAAALALLAGLDLHGWIVTADAKFTQKTIVAQIVTQGGDYVLTAKANQPTLVDDIRTLFDDPAIVADTLSTTRTVDLHGSRIEVRTLTASTALTAEYCGWAGLQQVFRLERQRHDKRSGQRTATVNYGITSLGRACADARQLARLSRGHWGIENNLHWVRDVDLGEDASRIRTGQAPQAMAIFRNVGVSLLGLCGYASPIAGLRHFAWNPADAVAAVTTSLHLPAWPRMK